MNASTTDKAMRIAELIFSGSGATIIVALSLLIIFLIIVFSPKAKGNWALKVGSNSLERTNESESSAGVLPAPSVAGGGSAETAEPIKLDDKNSESVSGTAASEGEATNPFIDMLVATTEKDLEEAYKRYLEKDGRLEFADSWKAYLLVEMGISSALEGLIKLEREKLNWSEPSRHLARYYQAIEEYDLALNHISIAITRASSLEDRSRYVIAKAGVLIEKKAFIDAVATLNEFAAQLSADQLKVKSIIFQEIAEIYKNMGETAYSTAYLEKALSVTPDDRGCRFKLAYNYNQVSETEILAHYHYRILAAHGGSSAALVQNNLGAVLGNLGDKVGEISAWKKGIGGDTDYPAGNLAIALINAGFLDEAEKYLRELPDAQKTGERARYAAGVLEKKKKDSDELQEKIKVAARSAHDFFLEASQAIDQNLNDEALKTRLTGKWIIEATDEKFEFKIENGLLSGELIGRTKKYSLTAKPWGALVRIKVTETMHMLTGLGLIFTGPPNTTPTWVHSSDGDEYVMWLRLKDEGDIAALKIKAANADLLSVKKLH